MVDKRVYDYLLKHSKRYSLSDLKRYVVSLGYDENVVNEAATAVIAQMGRAKAMERPQPVPKKLPMIGQKKTAVKKSVVKKVVPLKSKGVLKTVAKKQVKPVKQQVKDKNVKPVKENGKNLKAVKGKDVAKKPGKKWLWIILIILVVLLIAAGAVWYFLLR